MCSSIGSIDVYQYIVVDHKLGSCWSTNVLNPCLSWFKPRCIQASLCARSFVRL